jgi:hypothetical protein
VAQGNRNSNIWKESHTFKEAVILGGDIPSTSANYSGVNVNLLQNSNGLVNAIPEISLKLVLGVGPNNKWIVKCAEVLDDPSGNPVGNPYQAQLEDRSIPIQRPNDPIQAPIRADPAIRPKPTLPKLPKPIPAAPVVSKVWRPRGTASNSLEGTSGSTKPKDLEKVSVNSWESESESHGSDHSSNQSSIVPAGSSGGPPIAEVMQGIGEVNRTWGSPRDWFIELRDGRRLRIPVDLKAPVPDSPHEDDAIAKKLVQWLASLREDRDSGEGEDDSEWDMDSGSELNRDDLSLSGIPEQELVLSGESKGEILEVECPESISGTVGGDPQGYASLEPISVEPLAVVLPLGLEHSGDDIARSSGSAGRKPSDWVMRKHKGVGKVLGASYEGYEQTVMELLMDIEARYLQRKAGLVDSRRPSSSGRKGSRELKGLVSSINYESRESREAKGKGKIQGGDMVLYQ